MSRIPGSTMLVGCAALFLLAGAASAQNKVAVISLQRAVLESDEVQKALAGLEAKFKPQQQKLEALQRDIEGIRQQLQAGSGKLTPSAEADLTAQGQKKQRDLQRMSDDLQGDFNNERTEIGNASVKKMAEVVKKLAEEKGYDVVVDATNTVYFKPALDVTAEVLAAYNKAYPAPK
jgi:outer membrane protein